MRVLIAYCGALSSDIPFSFVTDNYKKLVAKLPAGTNHRVMYQTWSMCDNVRDNVTSSLSIFSHPPILYNPYLPFENNPTSNYFGMYQTRYQEVRNSPKSKRYEILELAKQLSPIKVQQVTSLTVIQSAMDMRLTRCMQHLALAKLVRSITDYNQYDLVIRMRYDTYVGDNLNLEDILDHCEAIGPVGVCTRYPLGPEYKKIRDEMSSYPTGSKEHKVVRKRYCDLIAPLANDTQHITRNPDEPHSLNDFMIVFKPSDFDGDHVMRLYEQHKLWPAECGWWQTMSVNRPCTNYEGGVGLARLVDPDLKSFNPVPSNKIKYLCAGDHLFGSLWHVPGTRLEGVIEELKKHI